MSVSDPFTSDLLQFLKRKATHGVDGILSGSDALRAHSYHLQTLAEFQADADGTALRHVGTAVRCVALSALLDAMNLVAVAERLLSLADIRDLLPTQE